LESLFCEVAQDKDAAGWLSENNYPTIDLAPLRTMVTKVRAETLSGWASVKHARGGLDDAIAALQAALELVPDNLALRLALGERLLEAGRATECQALVAGLPAAAKDGAWPDVIASLIAMGANDWVTAEHHLSLLAGIDQAPINASAWLGRAKLAQKDWAGAQHWFTAALRGPGDPTPSFEGLGHAQLELGLSTDAVQSFTQAIAYQPTNARFHLGRAQANERNGNLEAAQVDLWRVLAIDRARPDVVAHLAELTRQLISLQ
jgi:tetratricopeptide (TPR) repeat protein